MTGKLSVPPVIHFRTVKPKDFCTFLWLFVLFQVFPQGGIDELPENLCFKGINAVTDKNQDFHIVIQTLFFNAFIRISAIVCTVFLPKKITFENASQVCFHFLRKTVQQLRDFVF
jgi:hypothetical protein